jgi:hypothetical protein
MGQLKRRKIFGTRRTTTAELTYEEDGERKTEKVRISYLGLSTKVARALNEEAKLDSTSLANQLCSILKVQLVDITEDDSDKPATLTLEDFEELGQDNLIAINAAIRDDVEGKKSPSVASQGS